MKGYMKLLYIVIITTAVFLLILLIWNAARVGMIEEMMSGINNAIAFP